MDIFLALIWSWREGLRTTAAHTWYMAHLSIHPSPIEDKLLRTWPGLPACLCLPGSIWLPGVPFVSGSPLSLSHRGGRHDSRGIGNSASSVQTEVLDWMSAPPAYG